VCRGLLHMHTATHLLHTVDRLAHIHASLYSSKAPTESSRCGDRGQMNHYDAAVWALVLNQPGSRAMLIRVLRYLRLGFVLVREKILNELSDLPSLSVMEKSIRVRSCRMAAFHLGMAHEVCGTVKQNHLPSSDYVWRSFSGTVAHDWIIVRLVKHSVHTGTCYMPIQTSGLEW
jgi:hypothetical protein